MLLKAPTRAGFFLLQYYLGYTFLMHMVLVTVYLLNSIYTAYIYVCIYVWPSEFGGISIPLLSGEK